MIDILRDEIANDDDLLVSVQDYMLGLIDSGFAIPSIGSGFPAYGVTFTTNSRVESGNLQSIYKVFPALVSTEGTKGDFTTAIGTFLFHLIGSFVGPNASEPANVAMTQALMFPRELGTDLITGEIPLDPTVVGAIANAFQKSMMTDIFAALSEGADLEEAGFAMEYEAAGDKDAFINNVLSFLRKEQS